MADDGNRWVNLNGTDGILTQGVVVGALEAAGQYTAHINGTLTQEGFIAPQKSVGLMDTETAAEMVARYIEEMDHSSAYEPIPDCPVIPSICATIEAGVEAFYLFAIAGLAASNGAARRLIRAGGCRINDLSFNDETQIVTLSPGGPRVKVSVGDEHRMVGIEQIMEATR